MRLRALLLLALLAGPHAEGHVMSPTQVTSAEALTQALAAATDGATIELAAGHYAVNLALEHSVVLRGHGNVILDGSARGPVLTTSGAPKTLRLEGLTITNGSGQGAALSSHGISTIELVNVTVSGNRAGRGTAIRVEAGTLTLRSCQLLDNQGDFGAALLVDGAAHARLVDTTVRGNHTTGSAVAVRDLGELVIEGGSIDGTGAPIAIELQGTPGRFPQLSATKTTIRNPGATAISNGPRLPGRVTLDHTTVEGTTTGEITKK